MMFQMHSARDTVKELSKLIERQKSYLAKSFKMPGNLDELIAFERKQISVWGKVKDLIREAQKRGYTREDNSEWKEVFEKSEALLAIQTEIGLKIKEQDRKFILDGLKTKKDTEKLITLLRRKLLVRSMSGARKEELDDLASFIARIEHKLSEFHG